MARLLTAIVMLFVVTAAYAAADAQARNVPVKGTRDCVILQHEEAIPNGITLSSKTTSYLKFTVRRSGSIAVGMLTDTYPGSKFYFMIGGKLYSGDAGSRLPLDRAALTALKADKLIEFAYTDWPYQKEISRADVFFGFARAYDQCLTFLTKAGVPDDSVDEKQRPLSQRPSTGRTRR